MNASQVTALLEKQIGGRWEETNLHGVNLRETLVPPKRMKFIQRLVRDGTITDTTTDAWLVLEERPKTRDGYEIIYDEQLDSFGLASPGSKSDPYPSVDGFYGDFWSAFRAM